MKQKMCWVYNGLEFNDDRIPEGAVGFIYSMTAVINGTSVAYIGKKNFYASIKKKIAKKNLSTDKRLKKYTRVSKSSYQNYFSSNDVLKKAHKSFIPIRREILMICFSKAELTYQEVKHQFKYEVLEHDIYLNGNILGRFYKQNK